MRCKDFNGLEVARFELHLRAEQACSLPRFLGSTLRGAFGHALKQAVCVMPHRDCEGCLVADRCLYPYLFETPPPPGLAQLRGQERAPHPFILSPPIPSSFASPRLSPKRVWRMTSPDVRGVELAQAREGERTAWRSHASVSQQRGDLHERERLPDLDSSSRIPRLNLKAGEELRFGLVLLGRAIEYLPYVAFAMSEMARLGLGFDRARFALSDVTMLNERNAPDTIFRGDTQRITTPDQASYSLGRLIEAKLHQLSVASSVCDDPSSASIEREDWRSEAVCDANSSIDVTDASLPAHHVKLKFMTPTRIRVDGDLQASLSFALLIRNLLRRVSLLVAVHGSGPLALDYRALIEQAKSVSTVRSDLEWCDWERWSNRQETKMKLGGFVGEIEFEGEAIREFLPLLAAGELLHVGTGSSFGLGRYEVLLRHQLDPCG